MKIWVIGRGYPTTDNRMWGSFELEQAKLLSRNGNDVCYITVTLSFFDRKDPRGLRAFEDEGVKVYAYSHFYFPGKAGIYLEGFEDKCWRTVFRRVEKENSLPDIIHIHYPSMISSINEIETYRRQGVKLFVTEHWSRVLLDNLKKHELARLQYYASKASCFVCVSEVLQEAVRRLVNVSAPMEVIPNIVSPVFFEAAGRKTDEGITFITVGRLVPLKQFDAVIQQFLKEFSGDERARLRIIGSGSERKTLEKIARGNPQISFTGELSLAETAKEVAKADALVSYSKYETFAAPVAEAWACGKPVIVSSASGISLYVNKENGLVVDSNNDDALKSALRHIYDNHKSYSPELISGFAKDHFSDAAVMNKLNRTYMTY